MDPAEAWVAVIIEDEPDVRMLLDTVLTQSGFRTVVATDGPEGLEAVRAHNPLLTTLDVNMPGMDGFAVAKRIREFSQTYLIMITGLGDEIDVISGLEAGADDYLVKPFRPRELRARAESMLRRPRHRTGPNEPVAPPADPAPAAPPPPPAESWAEQAVRQLQENTSLQPISGTSAPEQPAPPPVQQPAPQPAPPPVQQPAPAQQQPAYAAAPAAAAQAPLPYAPEPQVMPTGGWIRVGELAVNTDQRVVTVGQRQVDLTSVEFELLTSLLMSGRRVRSKADLVLTMRGQNYVTAYFVNEADKREVEAHVESIRRKIGDDGANPRWIETVRGVGYRLAIPD
ncbi:response regulator transcription factor [Nocardioides massiliensis]|uniref:DNA-binding response OmpR family regulator n=1 Tax=Nocardioides massiliensis TaxID=1325935 RepID=A0ABT9NUW5_9ACTN|nr:response regulator transcription factor [Nocardioides massiliensis]MDP9824227.1 DNA-binding response OmpR family regulator [Nocardioides massiliensis]